MTTRRPVFLLLTLAALAAPAALAGCGSSADSWPESGLRVVVSFPPLDSFARKIVGAHGTVKCLCEGPGNTVHDFEPSPEDAAELHRADLFFVNGLGLDDEFTEELRINSGNARLKTVALGEPVQEKLKRDDGTVDPHVWMGIAQAREMIDGVRKAVREADPANAADYDENAKNAIAELEDLKKSQDELARKGLKTVCLHDSLRYFGLDVVGAVEVAPGVEPTKTRYDRIAELCKQKQAHLIAVPKPYADAAAKNIVDELKKRGAGDIQIVVIDPLESADDLNSPDWYKNKMQENFDALKPPPAK